MDADNIEPVGVPSTPAFVANNPGAHYDVFTGTDYPYVPAPGTVIAPNVNLRSVSKWAHYLDEVYDQGQMGSCVANSSAAIYRFEFKRHIMDAGLGNKHVVNPSRLFIYYNARSFWSRQKITDSGCQNRDSLHGLEKYGVCEEMTHPYVMLRDINTNETEEAYEAYKNEASSQEPNEPAYTEAANHKIKGYYRLDIDRDPKKQVTDTDKDNDGKHVKDNIRACLSEGHPFIFGFFWEKAKDNNLWAKRPNTNEWSFASLNNFKAKHVNVPGGVNGQYGHSVVGIGYDDYGVLAQNSWGTTQTQSGGVWSFWVPWEWITDFTATNDFWMIRVVGE